MTASATYYKEFEIVDVSVRRSWNGKLVLQARRRRRASQMNANGHEWVDAGIGPWRDVNANNFNELAEVLPWIKG